MNENGQGPPLVGDEAIIARLPFDVPGAPGKPEVVLCFMTLFYLLEKHIKRNFIIYCLRWQT